MIVLLHGANRLAIDERLQALRSEHDPTGFATTIIEQAGEHLADLRAASLAAGFFGATRIVIAHSLLTERTGGRGRKASVARDEIVAFLQNVPASTLLALVEPTLGAAERRALLDAIPSTRIETFDVPRGRDLVDWVCRQATSLDTEIDAETAGRLLEALFPGNWRAVPRRDDVPPDLYRLAGEINKLATAAGAEGRITDELVAALVLGAESLNVWGLTDAIVNGDPALALREVEQALASGVAAEALIGQLAGQFEVFAALGSNGGVGILAVAKETGLTEARLQQASRSLRHFPISRVRRGLAALRGLDVAAKRGETEAADAIVGIVVQLASER